MTNLIRDKLNDNEVSDEVLLKWKVWKWQLKNSISTIEGVEKILEIKHADEKRKQIEETIDKFP
uniref:hypothetical protein n=1 Tax=Oceanispirochaeta sp. TaxID=2035350 RepID=UPI00262223AD